MPSSTTTLPLEQITSNLRSVVGSETTGILPTTMFATHPFANVTDATQRSSSPAGRYQS